jgi:hypothetical protein
MSAECAGDILAAIQANPSPALTQLAALLTEMEIRPDATAE